MNFVVFLIFIFLIVFIFGFNNILVMFNISKYGLKKSIGVI